MNYFFTIISLLLWGLVTQAQKQVLTTDDFANWNLIKNRQISNNGKYISYELNQQKGDGKLIIYSVDKQKNDTIPFGYEANFSPSSEFIVFKIKPATDSTRAAKKAKIKKDKMPKDRVGIYVLESKETITYNKIKSFAIPKEKGSWVAVLVEHNEAKPDSATIDSLNILDTLPKTKKGKNLKDLYVHNPIAGNRFSFNHVELYRFAKKGKILGIVCKEKDSVDISTVITFNTELQRTDTIFRDTGLVKKLTIDKTGDQLAFLFSKDTVDEKKYSLYFSNIKNKHTKIIVDSLNKSLPQNYIVSEHGSVYFSDDGSKLFFGTAQKPVVQTQDSLLDEEKPKLDIWSWTDIELQPMQLKNLKKEKERNYLAVYRIKEKKLLQLGDTIIRHVQLINKNNGEVALGRNEMPYKRAASWNAQWVNDYYLIDLKNGNKKKILEAQSKVYLSPTGNHTVWYNFNDSNYYALNNKTNKTIALTKDLNVAFYDVSNDMPTNPYLYGIAGWTEQDEVLIYDRYDLWKFDLRGKNKAINMTNAFGKKNKTRFRYIKLNYDMVYIPVDESILLSAFDENTYQSGYYKTKLSNAQNPIKQLKGNFKIGKVQKAKNVDAIIWSKQTVRDYPEIRVSNMHFNQAKPISDSNPQQKNYNWASTIQVKWQSFTGETLRGILYKPENFDSTKHYPMIVYFYERSSEDIHRHYTPYPSHSIINKTFYASNGYLVFVPDITYKTGYPGQSAYNAIVSGTQYLINTCNFIDAKKIGLQGQSWGGYQTAFLITQTNMFAAAMGGAVVSNMTSAYGGIRWGTGMSRMFQYEHTQSRIGGTLWEKPMLYIENSPIFYAPKVNTPLLLMHNDNDGAVPWYQGIEYFIALRRLNKPVWMLNYNGMEHNIATKYWANRMDLSKRMLQFFNHYLKGQPAPNWMIKGVKAINKGQDLGY